MKVLITGANGLLGQKLINLLSHVDKYEVIATGRGSNRNPTGNYIYDTMDITDQKSVMSVMAKHQPDVLINTAAMTQLDQCEQNKEVCWKLNVIAVEYLVEACDQFDTFLLHLSTDFIFDGQNGPYDEESAPNPLSHYAHSKLASEQIVKKSEISWAIARTMLVYGIANDLSRSNIILWVKNSLVKGQNIKVVSDQWRMPTLAEDLARGCQLIVDKRAEGVYNVSGREEDFLSPFDMAIRTAEYFGLDKELIEKVDASVFTQLAKRPAKTGLTLEKSKRILGYNPVSFEEGLRTLDYQLREI